MSEDFRLNPQVKPSKSLNYHERVKAGLQRGGLRKVSKDKQKWLKLYHSQIDKDKEEQVCFVCGKTGTKNTLERHHPKGRSDKNILYYKYCCNEFSVNMCHKRIHSQPNKAREEGHLEM